MQRNIILPADHNLNRRAEILVLKILPDKMYSSLKKFFIKRRVSVSIN